MITLAEFMDKADDHRLDESRWAKAAYAAGALASAAVGAMAGKYGSHGYVDSSGKSHVQVQEPEHTAHHPGSSATQHYYHPNHRSHAGYSDGMKRYNDAVKRAEAERKK